MRESFTGFNPFYLLSFTQSHIHSEFCSLTELPFLEESIIRATRIESLWASMSLDLLYGWHTPGFQHVACSLILVGRTLPRHHR